MKIIHIEAGKNLYGGAKQVLYLMEGLQKRGVSNILITPKNSAISKFTSDFAKIYEINFLGDLDITFPFVLNRIIKKECPDIIHVHSRKGVDFWGGIVAKINKLPSLCTRRVDNPEIKLIARFKYRFYDYIVSISDGIKQVVAKTGIDISKLKTIRSALNPDPYRKPLPRELFLKEFGIPEDAITIGVIAQLIERKGHRYLIKIMPEIVKRFPNIRVIFFGKGALEKDFRKMISEISVENYFIFAGFRNDLENWIGLLDVVVHPADMEGLGVSLIQASAAGVPIIASKVGGIPEIVRDGLNGFLIEKANLSQLLQKLLIILNDHNLRKSMGANGMKIVDDEFSVYSMVEEYYKLYKSLLEK